MLGFHHGPLELEGGGELLIEHRKVAREDGKLLDTGGVAGNDRAVRVDGLDCVSDPLDPRFILACPGHRRDARADVQHIRIKHISSWQLASCPFCLERNQGNVELALVADHDKVRDPRKANLDGVFNWHGGNIFTSGADDKLLEPPGDLEHTVLIHAALVARVKPPFLINGFLVFLLDFCDMLRPERRIREIAHHYAAAAKADFALVLWLYAVQAVGPRAFSLFVEIIGVHGEHAHIYTWQSGSARAPQVANRSGRNRGTCALAHSVHLANVDTKSAKEGLRFLPNRRCAGEPNDAVVQAQGLCDFVENDLLRGVVPKGLATRVPNLVLDSVLKALGFGCGHQVLLDAL
mmetsp:Transcript_21731/g.61889  ORF Transcript_21731/g.61889 Transcript_21731/m.61889 type:complete len:349 (+) Transcript_21731:339-1385(+)